MPRTDPSTWGRLFNFLGAGLVHLNLFPYSPMSADNPTLFEAISLVILLNGTHAARPAAANVPLNAVYFETDTTDLFQNIEGTWTQIASIGGGGGGATLAQGTIAGRGSSSGSGVYEEITLGSGLSMTGTTLDTAGSGGGAQSLFTFSDVSAISFTATNGGGTFTSQTFGTVPGFSLSTPSESYNVRGRVIAAPSTPFTITAAFLPTLNGAGSGGNQNPSAGLMWRQSSDAKSITYGVGIVDGGSSGVYLFNHKNTNDTTFAGGYTTTQLNNSTPYLNGLFWLRLTDNGTNRISSYSLDGITFITTQTVGRTDFLTADQIGLYVNSNTSANTTYVSVVSWLQT